MHLLRLRRNNKHHQPHEEDRDPRTPHSSSSRVSSNEFDVRDAPSSNSSRNSGGAPTARFELKSYIRLRLYSSGTSLVTNDNDPIGDGDQSRVTDDEAQQVHQDLFRTGKFLIQWLNPHSAMFSDNNVLILVLFSHSFHTQVETFTCSCRHRLEVTTRS